MYLYTVIPFTKLPRPHIQTPLYFSRELFTTGQLIEVPLAGRKIPAVIIQRKSAEEHKQAIKKSAFGLKRIEKALVSHPIFTEAFLEFMLVCADYYYTSYGLMLQRMLPPFFGKPTKKLLTLLEELPPPQVSVRRRKTRKKMLVIGTHRIPEYQKNVTYPALFIAPEYSFLSPLEKLIKKNHVVLRETTTLATWRTIWCSAYTGNLQSILGTRSALFLPLKNCRSVLLDGESNLSHVSWDQHPKFDSRTMGNIMAEHFSLDLIMGDVIPSIERYWKALRQQWQIKIKKGANTPVTLIDMRQELQRGNTAILSTALKEVLTKATPKQKILLLISRRGLSSALVCRDCGFIPRCEACEAPLVLHKTYKLQRPAEAPPPSVGGWRSKGGQPTSYKLVCHRCGTQKPSIHTCPKCSSYRIKQLGGGTQQVLEAVQKIAPHLKTARLDSDTAKASSEQQKIFDAFRHGDITVLIGTQLALKEALLPRLDFAAAVMLDTITLLPAWQSTERVFNLLWRMKQITRKLMIQTYTPTMSPFQEITNNTFEPFFLKELEKRRALGYPPFTQIIRLAYSHKHPAIAEKEAHFLKQKLHAQLKALSNQLRRPAEAPPPPTGGWRSGGGSTTNYQLELLGPAPAYHQKIAGKYRWYILIKWPRKKNGDVYNLPLRNELLLVVPSSWEVVVDPVDLY